MFDGPYESYWHFHHAGRRFGHWLGCVVDVNNDKQPQQPNSPPITVSSAPVPCADTAVDLTMKCGNSVNNDSNYCSAKFVVNSTTDDMKIFESEIKNDEEATMANSDLYSNIGEFTVTYPTPSVPVADLLNIREPSKENKETETDKERKIENVTHGVQNMTIYGIPEEWKNAEMEDESRRNDDENKTQKERDDEEFNSPSDSDNISVISGTVSLYSDDTEPSDGFVVIPMPQCFNCEQALLLDKLPVTQPISVEIPKSEDPTVAEVQHESDNNNNMELKPYPELPMYLPVLMTPKESIQGSILFLKLFKPSLIIINNNYQFSGHESGYSEGENEPEKPQSEPIVDDEDPNNVYIRDDTGRSVPVAKVLNGSQDEDKNQGKRSPIGFSVNVGISHNTFGDPNIGHGPNGPRFPFTFNHETNVPPQCHNPGGSANFRPQHDCPKGPSAPSPETNPFMKHEGCHCPPHHPPMFHYGSGSEKSGCSSRTWSCSYQNIHTEQPRSSRYSYVYEKEPRRQSTGSGSSGSTGRRSNVSQDSGREENPVAAAVEILPETVAAAVEILPETLLTGAVNVASSAINTARSVLDMLRPRHDDVVVSNISF